MQVQLAAYKMWQNVQIGGWMFCFCPLFVVIVMFGRGYWVFL